MAQIVHEIEKFILHDPEKSESTVHVFVAQPTPLESRTFGRLFIIAEISSPAPINQELISTIQEEMRRAYYQGPQLRLETAFEQALQHVNEQLKHLIESGVTDWLAHFNIIVGVLKDQSLIFSHIGNINATLIHHGRIIDIVGTAGPEERKINPLKIFTAVITGETQEDDYLIFFTPSLLDYLSQEKLKRIVLNRPPVDTVRQLEELLAEAPSRTPFAALIVHCLAELASSTSSATDTQPVPVALTSQTQSSMEDLILRERATQRILTPSLWLTARQFTTRLANLVQQLIGASRTRRGDHGLSGQSSIRTSARPPGPGIRSLGSGLNTVFKASGQGGRAFGETFRSAIDRRHHLLANLKRIPGSIAYALARLIRSFPGWSLTRKILFFAIIAMLFFFAQSIVSIGRRNDMERTNSARGAMITSIEETTFQAEAALTYGDEVRASRLIVEAADSLAKLQSETKGTDETVTRLADGLEAVRAKTRHLVTLTEPEILAELGNQEDVQGVAPVAAVLRGIFYSVDQSGKSLLTINTDSQAVEVISLDTTLGAPIGLTRLANQVVMLYGANGNFVEYTPSNGRATPRNFTPANNDSTIVDVASYQSRVYLLDRKNRQIFRYQLGSGGFGAGTAWLEQAEDNLEKAVSLSVDGSVFILTSDGVLRKYTQGAPADFSLQAVDPALTAATKLWTDESAENLYILDRDGRRLLIFTKTGRLIRQYTSPAFNDLWAMAIDEGASRAYLLNGSTVYTVDLKTKE